MNIKSLEQPPDMIRMSQNGKSSIFYKINIFHKNLKNVIRRFYDLSLSTEGLVFVFHVSRTFLRKPNECLREKSSTDELT